MELKLKPDKKLKNLTMNENRELRGVFLKQPAYYFLLDGSIPISVYQFNKICDTINDVAALAASIKGASRISGLGMYYVCKKPNCCFRMQFLKGNFTRLHFALEDMKCLKESTETGPFDPEIWTNCLTVAVKQYECFMESELFDPLDWPGLQIVILTYKPLNGVLQAVRDALPSLNTAAVKKIQVIGITPIQNINEVNNLEKDLPEMQELSAVNNLEKDLPEMQELSARNNNEQTVVNSLEHLLVVHHFGSDVLHIEKFMKSLLHDLANDSEHLRIQFKDGINVLHCDMQEVLLNPDSIIGCNNFRLSIDIGTSHIVLPNRRINSPKVPVYELEAVGLIPTYRTCLNSLYGSSIILSPTTCWKTDWSLLQSNKRFFSAVRQQLETRQQLLVVRKKIQPASVSGNDVSYGYFGVFAPSNRNIMYIKALGTKELLLPEHPLADYEIPADIPVSLIEVANECLDDLTMYDDSNPVNFSSRLSEQLTKTLKKKTSQHRYVKKIPNNSVQFSGGPSPKKFSSNAQNEVAKKDLKTCGGKHEKMQAEKSPLEVDNWTPVSGKKQPACFKGVKFIKNAFEQPK